MKITPVFTEKSLNLAKDRRYTFKVDKNLTKDQVKDLVSKVFKVKVSKVRSMSRAKEVKRTANGKKKVVMPYKKVIVYIGAKEKIDLFETKSK